MNAEHIGDAQGWRDIATAPRDGSDALVYRPLARLTNDEPVAIRRLIGGDNYSYERTVPKGEKPCNPTDGSCHVTHWMPLPAPPSADPAPIKTSADTGELRDDILERLRALDFAGHYDEARFRYTADTILDLIADDGLNSPSNRVCECHRTQRSRRESFRNPYLEGIHAVGKPRSRPQTGIAHRWANVRPLRMNWQRWGCKRKKPAARLRDDGPQVPAGTG